MSQASKFEQLIAQGESQTLEFKKSLSEQKEGLKSLCAMVNSDLAKGTVIFGIEPDGSVCGIEPGNHDTAQRNLSQAIKNKFEPPLIVQIELMKLQGKQVIALSATRPQDVSYYEYDGRAYIRTGTEDQRLSIDEKRQLERKRNRDSHQGPWKCNRCGKYIAMLISFDTSSKPWKKNYRCECGGEYWPDTR